jgi:hypothetical protein
MAEDIASYVALASFIIMCALYLAIMKTYYPLIAVSLGTMKPYPSLESDTAAMLREFLAVQFFFWGTLWAVKGSLLFTFKVLTDGLPLERKIWLGVMAFTVLTYIGCCVTQFTSCSSIHVWLTAGTKPLRTLASQSSSSRCQSEPLANRMQVPAQPRETLSARQWLCGTPWRLIC